MHYAEGLNHFEGGSYPLASNEFQQAIKLYPDHLEANEKLALCAVNYSPEWESIIKFFNQQAGLTMNPFSEEGSAVYFGLGYCYVKSPDK